MLLTFQVPSPLLEYKERVFFEKERGLQQLQFTAGRSYTRQQLPSLSILHSLSFLLLDHARGPGQGGDPPSSWRTPLGVDLLVDTSHASGGSETSDCFSQGNVAGSGGYYIAAPATKIVANPGTITGSIGVVLGKFNVDAPAR